ncbi:MAG: molybdenum cofactor guanylyltransferase MobA [Dongiaceae bacterium]
MMVRPGHTGSVIVATVLAGGLGRRMGGGDKCLTPLGGRPLLDHVLTRIGPQVDAVILNANGDPARFEGWNLPVVPDSIEGFAGPLAGVLAGLDWVAANAPEPRWMVSVPGDAPFLPEDLVAQLFAALERERAEIVCGASDGRVHPVVALWPVAERASLRRALTDDGIRKVEDWIRRYRLAVVEFPATPVDPFFNANTPQDIAAAERAIAMR